MKCHLRYQNTGVSVMTIHSNYRILQCYVTHLLTICFPSYTHIRMLFSRDVCLVAAQAEEAHIGQNAANITLDMLVQPTTDNILMPTACKQVEQATAVTPFRPT